MEFVMLLPTKLRSRVRHGERSGAEEGGAGAPRPSGSAEDPSCRTFGEQEFRCDELPVDGTRVVTGIVVHNPVAGTDRIVSIGDAPERGGPANLRVGESVPPGLLVHTQLWRAGADQPETFVQASCPCGRLMCAPGKIRCDWCISEMPLPKPGPVDDGGVPEQSEVDAVMRTGMSDPIELVGKTVLYETDGRGGKRYSLPAIVTCVQRSHPDLIAWRALQEQGVGWDHTGMTFHGRIINAANVEQVAELGVRQCGRGPIIGDNPVPIPLDGTVHLHVMTPGPKGYYTELSVPYAPATADVPRSWRYHPDDVPF